MVWFHMHNNILQFILCIPHFTHDRLWLDKFTEMLKQNGDMRAQLQQQQ